MKKTEDTLWIFSELRRKWLVLTPEEWVRQHVIQLLHIQKKYPLNIIQSEKIVHLNGLKQRADLLVYKKENPFILVECKKPSVVLSQETWNQIMRYNQVLQAPYLMLTNGITHYNASFNLTENKYSFLETLPNYQ